MPGGVREGGREASPYSILDIFEPEFLFVPIHFLTASVFILDSAPHFHYLPIDSNISSFF
jgi:hypothetical protein